MSDVKLNWSSATVTDGELTVELAGDRPRGWKKSFEKTVRLLGAGGNWGEVRVKKGQVHLSRLTAGDEEKVRHFLDSVVTQANANHRPSEPDSDAGDRQPADEHGPDAEMTKRFRAFAEAEADAEAHAETDRDSARDSAGPGDDQAGGG
jgi:hypothetical protein